MLKNTFRTIMMNSASRSITPQKRCLTNSLSSSVVKKSRLDNDKVEESHATSKAKSTLLVSFDLEQTDGSFASEIYQIGAKCKHSTFAKNILPLGNIDWGVTKHCTNITVKKERGVAGLFDTKKKQFVSAVDAKQGLKEFLDWLNGQRREGNYKDVILISHGDGDMPALINNMARADLLKELNESVGMFADSLKYFQKNFKDWTKFRLPLVYAEVFPRLPPYQAHSAVCDASALHDILEELNKDKDYGAWVDQIQLEHHCHDLESCVQIARNRIAKTLAKAKASKKPQNQSVIKFLAPKLDQMDRLLIIRTLPYSEV